MSLIINHNLMASNAARNLNNHYGELSNSVRRLSSGLRVERAADDAAGLAIRELMRADIAAMNQGVRNCNDAISMIQTADGALAIIDEKLIRMKELAEQAATGTYSSDQRLMIDSEFQAMKAEIDRIAHSTEFNGIKLLCEDNNNKIEIANGMVGATATSIVSSSSPEPPDNSIIILNPNAITSDAEIWIASRGEIYSSTGSHDNMDVSFANFYENVPGVLESFGKFHFSTLSEPPFNGWIGSHPSDPSIVVYGILQYSEPIPSTLVHITVYDTSSYPHVNIAGGAMHLDKPTDTFSDFYMDMSTGGVRITKGLDEYPNATAHGSTLGRRAIDLDGDGNDDIIINTPISQNSAMRYRLYLKKEISSKDYTTKIHFGTGNDAAEDYYYIDTKDCTAKGLSIDSLSIETQSKAQNAIEGINQAIIKKDEARGYFGTVQNRLENTVSNLQVQAENLQASESRISDVDVATEMTEFVRRQIMTQSATAMLSQANSMPQMALQVIEGG